MIPGVLEALAALRPWDATEEEYLRRTLALVESVADPTDRSWYTPGHITASSFVLHPQLKEVALIHHAKLGIWVQPGGHVESGDGSHEEAARREVAEEIGLSRMITLGVLDLDIHTFPARRATPEHLHFDLRWAFRSEDGEIEPGDGVTAVRWVPFDEAAAMDPSIARPIRKLAESGW